MKIKQIIIHQKDLIKILKANNITLRELAAKTGLGYTRLFNYQSEYRTCDEKTWDKIKKVLTEKTV